MMDVTITLDDDIADRVRAAAAGAGKSVPGFVADVVGERFSAASDTDGLSPLERFLALPLMDLSENGRMPDRDAMYADRTEQLLRRHQRPPVSEGHAGASETQDGNGVD